MSAPDFTPGRYAEATHYGDLYIFEVIRRTARFVTLKQLGSDTAFRTMVRTASDGSLYAEVGRTATGPLVARPS